MDNEYRLKELGQFLKSRRERISPSQVGLHYGSRRRTPGLKREEVTQLANVSLTWYTWLEQGRHIKVSEQVLESVGKALLLNDTEIQYIFKLSQLAYTEKSPSQIQLVTKPVRAILDKLEPFPCFASDQFWNVIGWNNTANEIFGDFEKMNDRERNTIWRMFTNPRYKTLFTEWDKAAQWIVAQFRLSCSSYHANSWFVNFVKDLIEASHDFEKMWLEHNVTFEEHFKKRIKHSTVGELIFDFTSLIVADGSSVSIAVHTPADSETCKRLNKL